MRLLCDMWAVALTLAAFLVFSCSALLDELSARGHWREHAVMRVLSERWRAWDQRGISAPVRALAIEVLDPLLIANLAGRALFQPGASGKGRVAARHNVGVRSSHFQGFAWQTLLSRLSNDGMHAMMREVLLPSPYSRYWVNRTCAQNDCEGLFGEVTHGDATKGTPRLLGPRFANLEFRDMVKHDHERAKAWKVTFSKRAAYDPTDGLKVQEALAYVSGTGNTWGSEQARRWRDGQEQRAVAAAAGKQESARTFNTFTSATKTLLAAAEKRPRADEGTSSGSAT